MPQTMSQTLPQTTAMFAGLAAKKGGVASVLPRTSGAARSGRVVSGSRLRYNNIGK